MSYDIFIHIHKIFCRTSSVGGYACGYSSPSINVNLMPEGCYIRKNDKDIPKVIPIPQSLSCDKLTVLEERIFITSGVMQLRYKKSLNNHLNRCKFCLYNKK